MASSGEAGLGTAGLSDPLLMGQQPAFEFHQSPVLRAGKTTLATRRHDTMARDEQRNGIGAASASNGARAAAKFLCEFAIAASLTCGDFSHGLPNTVLKWRALGSQGNRSCDGTMGEEIFQLVQSEFNDLTR